MLEKIVSKMGFVRPLAVVGAGLIGVSCGGDDGDDCMAYNQLQIEGVHYLQKGTDYGQRTSALYGSGQAKASDDGCPSGCTSVSDTCCECSY